MRKKELFVEEEEEEDEKKELEEEVTSGAIGFRMLMYSSAIGADPKARSQTSAL